MVEREWCTEADGILYLAVHITPNAKKNEIIGVFDNKLKVRLHAQPIDGKANHALIRYLAELLNVPKQAVSIKQGMSSRSKIVAVRAVQLVAAEVRHKLLAGH